ncbi:MAG TPA: ATP synthase F1 subunit delta [Elusimicrobiales bacterium]|nr:ATP synthase F1 subunit delta [Elusimicrobiales bacterium]
MRASDRILARRYARAYALRAQDKPGQAHARLDELATLAESLVPLRSSFESPVLGLEAKLAALDSVRGQAGQEAVDFAKMLLDAKRFQLLDEIVAQCRQALDQAENILRAEVSSAAPLDKAAAQQLEKMLSERTGKKVSVVYGVEPGLLGGVRIKAGDLLIENSVKGRLRRLQDILQEAGWQH